MLVATDSLRQSRANPAVVLIFGNNVTSASLGTRATALRAYGKTGESRHFAMDRARSLVAALPVCIFGTVLVLDRSAGIRAFARPTAVL